MKIIDSNIIIYSAYPTYAYLRALVMDNENYVSAISQLEVLGYYDLSPAEKTYFESVFSVLQIIDIDDSIIQLAIELRQANRMKLGDAIIAASAKKHGLELYTRNINDLKDISGFNTVNPIA